ncbi:hypothetical protein IG631_22661 [Alternaria alternata]|nr:hypothetical protein IG631_22661 [Alternaria alternata]
MERHVVFVVKTVKLGKLSVWSRRSPPHFQSARIVQTPHVSDVARLLVIAPYQPINFMHGSSYRRTPAVPWSMLCSPCCTMVNALQPLLYHGQCSAAPAVPCTVPQGSLWYVATSCNEMANSGTSCALLILERDVREQPARIRRHAALGPSYEQKDHEALPSQTSAIASNVTPRPDMPSSPCIRLPATERPQPS